MRKDPVIAYRLWKVSSEGRLSTAYRNSGKWPWMKPYSATCDQSSAWSYYGMPVSLTSFDKRPDADHDAPHFDCTCGLYGYKSVECLKQTFEQYAKGDSVLGRVALWGKVVEHTDGYRAEYGYPQVLYIPSQDVANAEFKMSRFTLKSSLSANVRLAAQKYGIDASPLPEQVELAFNQYRAEQAKIYKDFACEWQKKNEVLLKYANERFDKVYLSEYDNWKSKTKVIPCRGSGIFKDVLGLGGNI